MTLFSIIPALMLLYLIVSLAVAYLAQQMPRHPVCDPPDWGTVEDTTVTAVDGGSLEVWRIEPASRRAGTVLFVHGWGRNRDRMVERARMFGQWGFTTVLFSVRDHGNSSPCRLMNARKFAEDIEAVLAWIGKPVILYGHSAGSAGAVIAAGRNPDRIRLLFLEGSYARTKPALLSLYYWFNPLFGLLFGHTIIFWLTLYYGKDLDRFSPALVAPTIRMPVMLIHGEHDRRFPLAFPRELLAAFAPGQAELFVAPGAGHSESSRAAGYPGAVRSFLEKHGACVNDENG